MSDPSRPSLPQRALPRRAAVACSIGTLSIVLLAACEKPSVRWLDATPVTTLAA